MTAAYPALAAERLAWLVGATGAAAVALLTVAVVFRSRVLLPWALVGLGAQYALWLELRGGRIDERAPVVAAGILLAAELGYWSLERTARGRAAGELAARRLLVILGLLCGALLVCAGILAAGTVAVRGSAAVEAVGVAAAVGVLALVWRLARPEARP